MISRIHGNLEGLKKHYLDNLELLYECHCERDQILGPDLAFKMSSLSGKINREVAVYINRRGQVVDVLVGDVGTISLEAAEGRRSSNRLSGIRCVHTHPGGTGRLSSVDISAMKLLRLDAMIAIGVKEEYPIDIYIGYIKTEIEPNEKDFYIEGPYTPETVNNNNFMLTIKEIEKDLSGKNTNQITDTLEEAALLVGLQTGKNKGAVQESLNELAQLAETAGVKLLGFLIQPRSKPDVAYYVGQGKAKELNLLCQSHEANVVIFDEELSPAQLRNLEQLIGVKVIDRTALILDIFAQRARTKEGKLQVELAQLNYLLPRLTGQGIALSRLGGGIGTRGPGETKLEIDRRTIRKRISDLEKELVQVRRNRELQRKQRKSQPLPTVALVGYTNAGKSTILNKLTNAGVLAENKLFATLDPTTRKITLPDNQTILLTDTVGFIKKIPHHLVAAFRATLEELNEADVLLHVVDASHPNYQEQISAVNEVLEYLDLFRKPIITVFNKIDQINCADIVPTNSPIEKQIYVSAKDGKGLDKLLKTIIRELPNDIITVSLKIPYEEGAILSFLYNDAKVLEEEFKFDSIYVTVDIDKGLKKTIERYILRGGIENEI